MAHRIPGVLANGTKPAPVCPSEDCCLCQPKRFPVPGTTAFSPDVGPTVFHSCCILPVLHRKPSTPGET